jgi:hypothetical protein
MVCLDYGRLRDSAVLLVSNKERLSRARTNQTSNGYGGGRIRLWDSPCCGIKRKKDLSERIHICDCGIAPKDRDVAAAMVMLNYARGLGTSLLGAESSSSISCGNMRQLGALKRQKLVPNL